MKVEWDDKAKKEERLTLIPEEGEPALRSCGKCNAAHHHLLERNFLHVCFECGQYFGYGYYFTDFKNEKDAYKKLSKATAERKKNESNIAE